ncbi:LytTR family DNA-binding domain-containing protein [Mangrovimonas sp. ST2L15]|uniref:LytR/AlgR family response regulator transcription factor n=1 Tax=Mangrovimonas sp. ST2L15 TaxID=1645916 RepID=UPI000A4601C2|nr:LytTR family DNA-binding domain-containing protein [Mangrovimonas sp. ST2L15]
MITVLIIEDEIKTAKALKQSIEDASLDTQVLGIVQSVKGALNWFENNEAPDLIFSDIQLADGLSFEIYRQIDIESPIIFCTAFDEYAIDAFKTNGIDYLLKPIDDDKLHVSLDKFQKMKNLFGKTASNDTDKSKLDALLSQLTNPYKKTILVHFQGKMIPLKMSEVAYLQYDLGNVYLVTFSNKKYTLNQTLDELESSLNPDEFFRANRQFIIHRDAVQDLENYFSRRMVLKLQVPTSEVIIVSKTKSPQLLRWLENA